MKLNLTTVKIRKQDLRRINKLVLIEILLVAHGSSHNDTIVTVEQKVK